MAKRLQLDERAIAEISKATQWTDDRTGRGAELARSVREALALIRERPDSCTLRLVRRSGIVVRAARVKGFAYHLIHAVLPSEIRVIACAHDRKRPFYWRSRLP